MSPTVPLVCCPKPMDAGELAIDTVDDSVKTKLTGGAETEPVDEAMEEVMRWLDGGAGAACGGGYQRSAFVTINGDEESCGSSFSDSDSTVMAYLDTRSCVSDVSCMAGVLPGTEVMMMPTEAQAMAAAEGEEEEDEEWVARVVSGAWMELGLL